MTHVAEVPGLDRAWLGAHVDRSLVTHIDSLAGLLGSTRSHVIRVVLRNTDVDRLLGDLRREADATPTGARGDGAAA
jgi:hypothetical protein